MFDVITFSQLYLVHLKCINVANSSYLIYKLYILYFNNKQKFQNPDSRIVIILDTIYVLSFRTLYHRTMAQKNIVLTLFSYKNN
jgi:hypothetical protein